MAARAIPVGEKLGCKRNVDSEVFSDATKQVTRNPKLVTDRDPLTWADLVFPLARHNFSVSSRNVDACIQTRLIVCISNGSTERYVRTD